VTGSPGTPPAAPPQRLDHRDPETARRIHALLRSAYETEAALIGAQLFPPLARTLSAVRGCDNEFIGCDVAGRLAGVLELEPALSAGELTIASLGVDPEFARRGIGLALVEWVLLRARGSVRVATAAANAPAIALYRRAGFRPTGETATAERISLLHLLWVRGG
jgi:ribosomal protein S18 acetylase RimI-like enzyme